MRRTTSFYDEIQRIRRKDTRYAVEAYQFLFEALDYTISRLDTSRQVTPPELMSGARDFAIKQYGLLAPTVFKCWGITRTADFGEIVFNLCEAGLMGKTDTDRKEDFADVFDFAEAFDRDVCLADLKGPERGGEDVG